jgi:predicted heme/steroid binding protein
MKLLPFILLMTLFTATQAVEPQTIYYGKVLEVQGVMGYKYLKVDENGTQQWVAIANAPVAVGDRIGYDKRTVMHDFESKSLGKTFKEIIFASEVYLPQKVQRPKSMKDMLGLGDQDPHKGMGIGMSPDDEEKPAKPFVKKDTYTVEEVHMWRKSLEGQSISLEGRIYKVSHQIMKRDWVHLGDGTGNEKDLTDDLVFTAASTTVKAGDEVIATGKVVVNKDFGYGYFYKVLIQDATFKVK